MAHWRIITQATNVRFGRRLRQVRRAAGLSQVELGRRAKMNPKYISRVEIGTGNPSLGTMALIADALQRDLADFFLR